MPVEHHHFEIMDPLIRAIHIELHPNHAIIEYYLNLPYLEPAKTENGAQTIFTATYGHNLVSIDIENKDAHIVVTVPPETGSVRCEFLGGFVSENPPLQIYPHDGLGAHQPQLPSGFIGE